MRMSTDVIAIHLTLWGLLKLVEIMQPQCSPQEKFKAW